MQVIIIITIINVIVTNKGLNAVQAVGIVPFLPFDRI